MTAEPDTTGVSRPIAWVMFGVLSVALAAAWLYLNSGSEARVTLGEGGVGRPARLDLSLTDLDGRSVALSSFKGKVILLNFWATWCGPCKAEIPDLVALQSSLGSSIAVLGVLVLDPIHPGTRPFVKEYGMNYPVLDGNDREDVETAFGPVWALPASVIVDPEGRIALAHRADDEGAVRARDSPDAAATRPDAALRRPAAPAKPRRDSEGCSGLRTSVSLG